MKLTNKQYDFIKRFLTIGVPAITAFLVTMGGLYGFPTDVAVGTVTAVATLAGVILNIISNNFSKDNDKPRIDPYEVDNEFTLSKDFEEEDKDED
ncbi:hypothetical protein IGI37_000113 [Enterococcus sp. AZ194]|uniref:phage holin n=1 Tax=Enterococcus sp. AZ194 TaxID=2774629 RepID=UPI003F298EE4